MNKARKYKRRVELHCHSKYSPNEGIAAIEQIHAYAKKNHISAVAITDHGEIAAFPEMELEMKKFPDGPHFIYGMEAYMVVDCVNQYEKANDINHCFEYHATILVKNEIGKKNLYKLVTLSHAKHQKKYPRIAMSEFLEHREGLLLGSGCENGMLFKVALEYKDEEDLSKIAKRYDFIEVQPLSVLKYMTKDKHSDEELLNATRRLISLGEKLNIPVVATSNAHYLRPEDALVWEIMREADGNVGISDGTDLHFRTTKEMMAEFDFLPKEKAYEIVVENPAKIAEQCELLRIRPMENHYPSCEGDFETLCSICMDSLEEKYGDDEAAMRRLTLELKSIKKTGTAFAFLLVRELLQKNELSAADISIRGTAGGSIVMYLTGISEIDPMKYHLQHETVFGCKGDKKIDIDMNLPADIREQVFKSTESLSRVGKALRAGTKVTLSENNATRMIRRYEIEHDCTFDEDTRASIKYQLFNAYLDMGKHPGKVLLSKEGFDVESITPFCGNNGLGASLEISYFDGYFLDSYLYSLDLLEHSDLTRLRMFSQRTGVMLADVPTDSEEALDVFRVDPMTDYPKDCKEFSEFGDKGIQKMMRILKPDSFDDLVKILGLVHGTGTWNDNVVKNVADGKVTIKDIIASRDDIFDYCISIGIKRKEAYNIMEYVRKGGASCNRCGIWSVYKDELLEHGASDWLVDSLEKIRYLFPRAHAISYVMVAMRLAWFKVHYPVEYKTVMQEEP